MMTCLDSRRELLVIADRPATLDEADIIPMAFGHPAVRVQSVFTGAISKGQANVQLLLLISNTS